MKQHGFTLIELLVAIGILLLMIGLALAGFISFNDRQKLTQAQEMVREAVANAQNSARSGQMRGCDELSYYSLNFLAEVITMTPACVGGTSGNPATFNLPSGTEFESSLTLYISPVKGLIYTKPGLTTQATVNLIIQLNSGNQRNLTIDPMGSVKLIN